MAEYIRWEGKVRETGTRVQILDLAHPDSELDVDGGNRWATFCLDHGLFVTHPTSQLAWDHSAHPLGWCDGCANSDGTWTARAEAEKDDICSTCHGDRPDYRRCPECEEPENTLGLPAKSLAFFRDLAEDAPNWSGNPWLSGNVASGRSASAMSQTLVKAGLIEIGHDNGDAFAIFTEAGKAAAAELGIQL